MPKSKPLFTKTPDELLDSKIVDVLYSKVASHIDSARESVQKTVDAEMVKAYWLIGRDIIHHEQAGKARAEYGRSVLKQLSKRA